MLSCNKGICLEMKLKWVLFCVIAVISGLLAMRTAFADTLSGSLSISYSSSSSTLSATYTGDSSLKNPTFTWYKDGTAVSTSREFTAKDTGTYTCEMEDSTYYSNKLKSTSSIRLYSVSGDNIKLSNSTGLYEAGKSVTVSASLGSNEKVVNWKTNVNGVTMPSSGTSVSFTMPSSNVTVTCETKAFFAIKITGGTADKYTASPGDIITVTASDVDGKKFSSWTTTGGSISNAQSETATLTMPSKNIQVTANFTTLTDEELAARNGKKAVTFTDPTRVLYTVPWSNNYKVVMEHHAQGPLCDLAFKLAAAGDFLVLDYFNIIINDNYNILETPTPVTICLTLPADLQWAGRNWRVLCVSRGGLVYSFPDEDEDDTTLTFSPDRFYAFAICYNDNPDPVIEEPVAEEIQEEEEEVITIEYDPSDAHTTEERAEKISSSPSASHSVSDSQTITGSDIIAINRNGKPTSYSTPVNVESDKQAAIRNANGAKIATLPL